MEQPSTAKKESDRGTAQQKDGVAVSRLNRRRGGAGAVEALGTTLRLGDRDWAQGNPCERHEEPATLHWAYSRRANRKTQSTPITCQYQTAESTTTCRVAIWRE